MSLRVYNTLSQQKELFEPVKPGKVGIYLCGPTVYKPPHIGHMVGPVIFDAIKRYLTFKGFEVNWVVNITDVDDKLIAEASATGQTMQQVAERCTEQYLECLRLLGIDTVDRYPKASEHIEEITRMIQTLIDKNHAYAADGNVWFAVETDPDYGKLSHRTLEEQEAVRATEGSGKRNPADFALWKAAKPGEPKWDSPWGPGRPGWHIECSAMSIKYLGETFDFHGGGLDLLFPHHENELAQSQCATDKPFARYWLHNGLTRIKTKAAGGEWKMIKQSKSLGNVIDAKEFITHEGPDLLRYLLLSTHYRRPIDFSDDVIAATRKGLSTFERLFERVDRLLPHPLSEDSAEMERVASTLGEGEHAAFVRAVTNFKMKFLEMMDDDFNTAGAIAVMHELAGAINALIEQTRVEKEKQPAALEALSAATVTLRRLGYVMGLFRKGLPAPFKATSKDNGLVEGLMQLLIRLRQEARASKNFALADGIRKGLTEVGVTLEDRPNGTGWRKGTS